MTGGELRTSGIESDRSANWATTTSHPFFSLTLGSFSGCKAKRPSKDPSAYRINLKAWPFEHCGPHYTSYFLLQEPCWRKKNKSWWPLAGERRTSHDGHWQLWMFNSLTSCTGKTWVFVPARKWRAQLWVTKMFFSKICLAFLAASLI